MLRRRPRSAILVFELAVARLRHVQRVLQRADLLAQGRDLLVEQFDLAQRLLADLTLGIQFAGERADALLGRGVRAGAPVEKLLQARALRHRRFQRRAQVYELILGILGVRHFEREKLRKLVNLRVQAV